MEEFNIYVNIDHKRERKERKKKKIMNIYTISCSVMSMWLIWRLSSQFIDRKEVSPGGDKFHVAAIPLLSIAF